MFRNYLSTACRNLVRNKFYTSINIAGLAIGLSVSILILLWVQDELSYDKFHSKSDRIYKINSHLGTGIGHQVWDGAPSPIAVKAKDQIPEIENVVRLADNWDNYLFVYGDKRFTGAEMTYADPSFFSIFDFKYLKGNREQPFPNSRSVVLTNSVAKKMFNDQDPIGKIIVADKTDNFTVSGVIEDFPANSTLKYEMIFPMQLKAERFRGNGDWKTIDEDLGNYVYKIFILLRPDAQPEKTAQKISRMYDDMRGREKSDGYFALQSVKDLHLYTRDGNGSAMQTVQIFIIVAILILIIACINYVNLSTARSILRSKEVSVRKIIGAQKRQLFVQFLFESALLFGLSTVMAYVIIQLLLPLYNQVSGKALVFDLSNTKVWLVLGASILGSLLISGIYPAMLVSSFKPVESLKGKFTSGLGNIGFRKVLVVAQFIFSVGLIISTIIIGLQLKYMREKDLGFDREHVFSFNLREEMNKHFAAVRTELMSAKGVIDIASSMDNIVGMSATTGDTEWEGKPAGSTFLIHPIGIDEHFIPLFKMELKQGRNFSGTKADSAYMILNETAVKEAGIKDAVGKKFELWGTTGTIIGVVKDFNYASLKQKIEPMVFFYQPSNMRMFIKTTGQDASNAIAAAQKIWDQYSPGYPFNYSFADEDYDRMYKAEQRTGLLFNVFAMVAITISCLGLFGLATYTSEVKRKEMGIRKVLGASIANIAGLLARDFIVLVLISLVIAIPIAWWTMHNWLEDFVYRISMSWWIFAVAGAIALLIAVLTISFQALKTALANPVKSLKEE